MLLLLTDAEEEARKRDEDLKMGLATAAHQCTAIPDSANAMA